MAAYGLYPGMSATGEAIPIAGIGLLSVD